MAKWMNDAGADAALTYWSDADKTAHADMGFAQGWGICADQLEQVAKTVAETADA